MSLHLYLEITRSLGIKEPDPPSGLGRVVEELSSWFEVSGLAEASIAAAAAQVALRRPLAREMTLTDLRTFGFVGWGKRQRTHHLVQDDGSRAAQPIQRRLPKMGPR
jgi:hypothetical protein